MKITKESNSKVTLDGLSEEQMNALIATVKEMEPEPLDTGYAILKKGERYYTDIFDGFIEEIIWRGDLDDYGNLALGYVFRKEQSAEANKNKLSINTRREAMLRAIYHKHFDPLGWEWDGLSCYTACKKPNGEILVDDYCYSVFLNYYKFPRNPSGKQAAEAFIEEAREWM